MKAPSITKGPWSEYTSNSFSRIGTKEGYDEIIYATRMSDGFPTLSFKNLADKPLVIAAPMLAEVLNAVDFAIRTEVALKGNKAWAGLLNDVRAALKAAGYEE